MNIDLKPYDEKVQDRVFWTLFHTDTERDDGLTEIPAESYQLIVSALELIKWELHGEDRETAWKMIAVVERLRDEQKARERGRHNV